MSFKGMLRMTNWKIRLLVGLFLIALFCIQCTQVTTADREAGSHAVMISGTQIGQTSDKGVQKMLDLAHKDQIALLETCLAHYRASYKDFTCTFIKQERLGGKLGLEQTIEVKFLQQPYCVAMAWVKNVPTADRALYIEGENDDQMMVRPAGLLSFVGPQWRKPDSRDVMKNTLKPINKFGFERNLLSLLEVYRQAKEKGDLTCEVGMPDKDGKRAEFAEVNGRRTLVLVRMLPAKDNYPAKRTEIYIDVDYMIPTLVKNYNWEDQLASSYVFKDLKFNTGLNKDAFLPEANGMGK